MKLAIFLFISGIAAGNGEARRNEAASSSGGEEGSPREERRFRGEPAIEGSLDRAFERAVRAYLEEDWDGCIEGFREAQHGYKLYKRSVTNCRERCRKEVTGSSPMLPENIEDLHFYEKKVKETLCLMACNRDYREVARAKVLDRLPRELERKLVARQVYEYLHVCYYQRNRNQDAANAAFTYLAHNPEHVGTAESLKFYLTLPKVSSDRVVNLEAEPYVRKFFEGVDAYEREAYREAVARFESSLESYLNAEEECRFYCEGPFDQGWHPEFTASLANHFAYCLKCKRACSQYLNNVNGDYRADMLRTHYDYLQFSYYKLGNLRAACAAVESYLLFAPADETMLHNKAYYTSLPKVESTYFVPREEALSYLKRQEYEQSLLRYISQEFRAIDAKLEAHGNKEKPKKGDGAKGAEEAEQPAKKRSLSSSRLEAGGRERVGERGEREGGAMSWERREEKRYVADGFLDSRECEVLLRLAEAGATEGDGYEERRSPHSIYERFEGLTIGRAALMSYFGQVEPEVLELLLSRSEAVRDRVEERFGLERRLHPTYTHLVCRTALPDSPAERHDLSHEIHADNCIADDEGACHRESPAFTWRDYSAILYLNDDFEGGEFFFAERGKGRQAEATISPRCGRVVAFSAGGENLHGVRAVSKGRRCAIALWFTRNERHEEYERILARAILERMRLGGPLRYDNLTLPAGGYEELLVETFEKDATLMRLLREATGH
ncbi:hypothetical protein KM043_000443 [Ampulex compressa]|nr:hypothetical protein KM043_000443 [Ampulex compressa]